MFTTLFSMYIDWHTSLSQCRLNYNGNLPSKTALALPSCTLLIFHPAEAINIGHNGWLHRILISVLSEL